MLLAFVEPPFKQISYTKSFHFLKQILREKNKNLQVKIQVKLQIATHDHHGNPVDIMSRILETNEADSLRARVIRHTYEHFDEYRHVTNADLPNHKHYDSIEEDGGNGEPDRDGWGNRNHCYCQMPPEVRRSVRGHVEDRVWR